MQKSTQQLLREIDQKGFVALDPIPLTGVDSSLLGNACGVAPSQSLFHYLSFERFRQMLQSRGIYLRRIDLFQNDPREGRFPEANARRNSPMSTAFAQQLGISADALTGRADFLDGPLRLFLYVHCWFGWDAEDPRMWTEYGDGGRGVCIRTTARRLMEAIGPPPHLHCRLHTVTYSAEEIPIPELISFLPAVRKRPESAHEREIRLLAQLGERGCGQSSQQGGIITPDHQLVAVNFNRLFERVYVGPNAPDSIFRQIEDLANNAAESRVAHRSTITQSPAAG